MLSPRQHEALDGKKYDPHANQWMREALDGRQTIDELKAQNDKLQREVYALNSKLNLIYECLGDLGVVDRVGDLMQKKIQAFQQAQYARQNPPQGSFTNSPRQRRKSTVDGKSEEGFICGSSMFQETAGFSSSYEGQVGRDSFHRKNMFDQEEAQYREKFDIFGKPRQPSPTSAPTINRGRGDVIDSLLSSGTESADAVLRPSPNATGGSLPSARSCGHH